MGMRSQDLQDLGNCRIPAVVENSTVVQTFRPEIDQETDFKTIGDYVVFGLRDMNVLQGSLGV